ncbi:MAG: hypothetical protein J6X70_07500 [Muribaculaceae bacterium]|nr:hypothetical protein [Muribaculaceae bacterium]
MTERINKYLETIEKAVAWKKNVPAMEQLDYMRKLVNIRRGFKKIKFAADEPCSTAAFGESQMGKSYLISAMLSDPGKPFTVTDGKNTYNFIDEVNPSVPNGTLEATGVVTRFTTKKTDNIPDGHLKVRLLTITDIILVMCEAYHNQVNYENNEIRRGDEIKTVCENMQIPTTNNVNPIIGQDDVMDIKEYLENASYHNVVNNLLDPDTGFFSFLLTHVERLTDTQLVSLIKLLWNENSNISRLFDKLLNAYKQIKFNSIVFVPFEAVLKKHGTLLDVKRLDEIFDAPVAPPVEYRGNVMVKLADGSNVDMPKSELSALVAELYFSLPALESGERKFLGDLDILDFPGERRPEKFPAAELASNTNLSTILRRGKVTYLFNRYSDAKRISSLMFCHNNRQSAQSTMGMVLDSWVNKNVGATPEERRMFMNDSLVSPLFIISTFFNMDLKYQTNDKPGERASMDERWTTRFQHVLVHEVLHSDTAGNSHWFNTWDSTSFRNIFMLRDFKYSDVIFDGYNPNTQAPETNVKANPSYPNFLDDLRESFLNYPFVQKHFENPQQAWDGAATLNEDGTHNIIAQLNKLAPRVSRARETKFNKDILDLLAQLNALLSKYYHSGSIDEEIKAAKKQAAIAKRNLTTMVARDEAGFGVFIDSLMVDEPHIFEIVHDEIMHNLNHTVTKGPEATIFMEYGLSADNSRDQNMEMLMEGMGVDTEEELAEVLKDEFNVELENVLKCSQIAVSNAEQLVTRLEDYWFNTYLLRHSVEVLQEKMPAVPDVISKLEKLYKMLGVHRVITDKVEEYMKTFNKESSVNIIADYLSIELNKYVSSFGYDYLTKEQKREMTENNGRLKLGIDDDMIGIDDSQRGVQLLVKVDELNSRLEKTGITPELRKSLRAVPHYGNQWRWIELMKTGYMFACNLPDYDVQANQLLSAIIDELKN